MDYSSLTVKKLQQLSKKEGLPTKGSKQDLIDGLEKLPKAAVELIVADLPKPHVEETIQTSTQEPIETLPEESIAPSEEEKQQVSVTTESCDGTAPAVAPMMLRTSSRTVRPRIRTMCVGCHHHPTHVSGKVTRRPVPAVVDDASVADLARKFSNVKILAQQQQPEITSVSNASESPAAPAKSSAKTSKLRVPKATTRAPLSAKSNQVNEKVALTVDTKLSKGKVTSNKKKVGSLKDLTAAPGSGKENLPSGLEEAKVTTERPGRKVRSLRQVSA